MKRAQINFFATHADLEGLLKAIHAVHSIYFVRSGLFELATQDARKTLLDDSLGIAKKGDSNHEETYLVADENTQIATRSVPQHSGGIKYAIDQQMNPQAIVFRPGGIYGNNIIIAGYVGTISQDVSSTTLFKSFGKEINRQFVKIKSFHVGKQACENLENGWRLTTSEKSPLIYDLKK